MDSLEKKIQIEEAYKELYESYTKDISINKLEEDKRESYFDKDFEEAEWEQLLQKEEEYCKIQEKIDAEEREKERQKLLNTKKSTFLYDFSGDDSSLNLSFW